MEPRQYTAVGGSLEREGGNTHWVTPVHNLQRESLGDQQLEVLPDKGGNCGNLKGGEEKGEASWGREALGREVNEKEGKGFTREAMGREASGREGKGLTSGVGEVVH